MKLKLNVDLKGHKKGSIIKVADINGIPNDLYWRNRLKDSAHDSCVEVVKDEPKKIEGKEEIKIQEKAILKYENKSKVGGKK